MWVLWCLPSYHSHRGICFATNGFWLGFVIENQLLSIKKPPSSIFFCINSSVHKYASTGSKYLCGGTYDLAPKEVMNSKNNFSLQISAQLEKSFWLLFYNLTTLKKTLPKMYDLIVTQCAYHIRGVQSNFFIKFSPIKSLTEGIHLFLVPGHLN